MGTRGKRILTAVVSVAALAAPVSAATAAQAAPVDATGPKVNTAVAPAAAPLDGFVAEKVKGIQSVTLRNVATGLCLETARTGGHTFTARCSGSAWQNWDFVNTTQGWKKIVNAPTGWCLDGNRSTGAIYTGGCNGGQFQNWTRWSTGQVVQQESTQYLDSNSSGSAYLSPGNGGDNQKWYA